MNSPPARITAVEREMTSYGLCRYDLPVQVPVRISQCLRRAARGAR
jgi:hypothetical protein